MTLPITASVELECAAPDCGLNIHVGDDIVLGPLGWVHPVCSLEYSVDLDAERRHDADRERGA